MIYSFLRLISIIFICLGLGILFYVYSPILQNEVRYNTQIFTKKKPSIKIIKPIDDNFGIVIPKIGANAKVIADVNPYDDKEYQKKLAFGVAHAAGTSKPGFAGNTFIFAHSAGTWNLANRYNAVFYLLNKLKANDEVLMYYQKKEYKYKVNNVFIVNPEDISYIKGYDNKPSLTLMTCWPPGTTFKRLIVTAKLNHD